MDQFKITYIIVDTNCYDQRYESKPDDEVKWEKRRKVKKRRSKRGEQRQSSDNVGVLCDCMYGMC